MPLGLPHQGKAVVSGAGNVGVFLRYALNRYLNDRCLEYSASLTFTTLLAFVPMMVIALAILSQFPVFDDIRSNLQTFILESFVPEAGTAVLAQFNQFIDNAGKLSAFGAAGLTIAVFMLLLAIESAFNDIWHVTMPRPFMWRVLAFWTVLTLGPILIGFSVSLSSYLFATAQAAGVEAWTGPGGRYTKMLPPILEFAAFSLLYGTIPNRPVKVRHAAAGALVATIAFESLKKGFGLYVTNFPTYQTIYGAMATIPMTLIWVYMAWAMGLLGAVIAASLTEWKAQRTIASLPQFAPGIRLTVALSVLAALRSASVRGEVCERKSILKNLGLSAFVVETILGQLSAARYVTRVGRDSWVLARGLDETTLYDLYTDLDLGVDAEALSWVNPAPWVQRAGESITSFDSLGRDCMAVRLKELFAEKAVGDGKSEVVPFGRRS
jgi:membrane protein